ncbi:metal ABC transporter substrate-binding protein [Streptomyces griseocarneus]|uniref:metal ABC transporter substrate-binding protein n=1 Tax=Streptomyces griseocarneus TaxID=51201 RepID=UPI001984F77D|nr:metal ABC transporter substrate-binding protein [Streptomyces griseocarneus]MBZ6472300.1 metal ABC transporter substrate-binding protein [Streptomyces griseocarneus]GHG72743.1 zinc ABC transporter substrate-binding protein [Streptomyces griseocarneus]
MNVRPIRPIRPLRRITTAAVALAATLGLVSLTACSAMSSDGRTKDGKLRVVASFYPMEFLAKEIGGEHVAVTGLTKPGVEPHDLELTPRQTGSLADAGAIVYLKGIQPAVDTAIKQSGNKHVADAAALTRLEEHGTEVEGDEHGHDEGGHEGHEHHDEGGTDPHVWLDPLKYAEVAKGVARTLSEADPDHGRDYDKNAAALADRLRALDRKYTEGLKNRASDTFITTHAAFGYLAERYGLDQEAIGGVDPESEPSAARMKDLHALAKDHHVGTVFFETLASPKTARTLAKDLGLKTNVLDPVEGITDDSKGSDYFAVMESNLAALQKALGTK